jgi:hypothetical protein
MCLSLNLNLLCLKLPLFEIDVDGSTRKNKVIANSVLLLPILIGFIPLQYVIGRRNYAIARMDATTRDLIIDIRLEIVQGEGNTKP